MQLADHVIGVCSWSLRCHSIEETVKVVKDLGLAHMQLALGELISAGVPAIDDAIKLMEREQVQLTAGMIGFSGEDYTSIATIRQTGGFMPDADWDQRRKLVESAARTGQRMHLAMVSTHIGFVPSSNEQGYEKMVVRVRDVADLFRSHGLQLLMETGQEGASELLQFLNDVARPNVGVNFDPANMILYGAGNPVDAVRVLGRHVHHVHIKDATSSSKPGTLWGEEVPFGKGDVNATAFIESLRFGGYRGPLVVEREAGAHRYADVQHAIGVLRSVLTPRPTPDGE
jgi:sugar phosphate isomerase/epimerase